MSDSKCYDIAILGGGSAGYAAARTASDLGMKTVVIDGADQLAGLCILRGCMPSKTLIETANRALAITEADKFGIETTGHKVSPAKVIERKRKLIAEFQDYRQDQLSDGRFDLIRGNGKFINADTIRVDLRHQDQSMTLSAKTSIVATGSTISVPDIEGLEQTGYLTSDDVLDSKQVPDSIIVLGGGAIALEMAHFYNGIGVQVTVIQRSGHLLTGMDHDLADTLQAALEDRSINIFCDTQIEKVQPSDNGQKCVHFTHKGNPHTVAADEILCALGRRANTSKLGTDTVGIKLKNSKIDVSPTMQSSQPNIFAAGDVASPHEIVHIAIEQGEMAARNAHKLLSANGDLDEISYRLKLYGIFTEPQVASVGLSELEAREKDRRVLVNSYQFDDHGKSIVHGSKHGFVKLIADAKTKEILGGAVIGPEATELIHEIAVAMSFRATAQQLARIPHYHPTLSEIWTYPAEEIADA